MSRSTYTYKFRILFISHSGEMYGSERSLLTLLSGLKELDKYEIMVFIPEAGPLSEACAQADVPFRIHPFERWIGMRYHSVARYYRRIRNRLLIGRLIRQAERWMPDLIYTNTIATPLGAMLTERLMPRPLHLWHARELPGNRSTGFGLFDPGRKAAFRFIARNSDILICNSHFLRDRLVPGLLSYPARSGTLRAEVVYNGLECPAQVAAPPVRITGCGNKPFRLIMAGGISAVKNHEEAIAAVRILTGSGMHVSLEIYGSGRAEDLLRLNRKIRNAGMQKHIRLMGYHSRFQEVLVSADILLITSRMETFGRTAVEAMLCRCPVVCSDAGALPEIIRNGHTGLVYRSGEPHDLARRIRKLTGDPALKEQLIRNAWNDARSRFSIGRFVADIDRLLQELLGNKKTRRDG